MIIIIYSFLHPADTKNPKLIQWLCKEEVRYVAAFLSIETCLHICVVPFILSIAYVFRFPSLLVFNLNLLCLEMKYI